MSAVREGETLLRAEYEGLRAFVTVEVRGRKLDEIRVAPRSAEIRPDGKLRLKAWGTYESGAEEEITEFVTWSSSDDRIALVSNEAECPQLPPSNPKSRASCLRVHTRTCPLPAAAAASGS